jgi:hypothetical protein
MIKEFLKIIEDLKCCGNCGEANGIYDCKMKPIEFYKCDCWIANKTIEKKHTKEIIEEIEELTK